VISKVINKIREATSLTLILVAPELPTKPWYPDLMSLTSTKSLRVGKKSGSIIQYVPHQEEPVVMEDPEILKLRAWIVQK
jgi:hypothetical protein